MVDNVQIRREFVSDIVTVPEAFGAIANGTTDDSTAIYNAQNSLTSGGIVWFSPNKTYLISISGSSLETYYWNIGPAPGQNLYTGVELTRSNIIFEGNGATLKVTNAQSNGDANINYVFASKEATAISGITFRNFVFDFDGTNNANQRGIHINSGENILIENCEFMDSSASEGYGIGFVNSSNLTVRNNFFNGILGGVSFLFCSNVSVENNIFDGFSEGVDCENVNYNVSVNDNLFRNGGTSNECVDISTSVGVVVANNTAKDSYKFVGCNGKKTISDTYAHWKAGSDTAYRPSRDVVISGNACYNCSYGSSYVLIEVGNDWPSHDHNGVYPVQNISIVNNTFEKCGQIYIWEGKNIIFDSNVMHDIVCPTNQGAFSATCEDDSVTYAGCDTYSVIETTISNNYFQDIDYTAIQLQYVNSAIVTGNTIKNANSGDNDVADVKIWELEERNGYVLIDNNLIIGGSNAYRGLIVNSDGGTPQIVIGKNKIIGHTNTQQIELQGDAEDYVESHQCQTYYGTVAAGSDSEKPIFVAPSACYVFECHIVTAADIVQNDADYETFSIVDKGSDGTGADVIQSFHTKATGGKDVNDFDAVAFDFEVSETHAYLAKDDVLSLDTAHSGNGQGFTDLVVIVDYIPI